MRQPQTDVDASMAVPLSAKAVSELVLQTTKGSVGSRLPATISRQTDLLPSQTVLVSAQTRPFSPARLRAFAIQGRFP